MNEIITKITNCMDCEFHCFKMDPDPNDSFNDDDCAILCSKSPNVEGVMHYASALGRFEFRPVTMSCRPYNKRKECDIPDWCPRLEKK